MKDGKNMMIHDGAAQRGGSHNDRRYDGPRSCHHRIRKQEPYFLLPSRSSSGGSDKRMLGLTPTAPCSYACRWDGHQTATCATVPTHSTQLLATDTSLKQTVEMRSPDGSADIYQLIAGLCVACRHGFEMKDALEIAEKTYVNYNIHDAENAERVAALAQLPDSCAASADCLEKFRKVFEEHGVFSPMMIDGIQKQLRAFGDKTLREDMKNNEAEILKLVEGYFHCGDNIQEINETRRKAILGKRVALSLQPISDMPCNRRMFRVFLLISATGRKSSKALLPHHPQTHMFSVIMFFFN